MKTTFRILHESQMSIQKLAGSDLPVKTALKVLNNQDKISEALKNVNKLRSELLQKYGTPAENGMVTIAPENVEKFFKSESELLDVETKIVLEQVTFAEIESCKLTANDLRILQKLIIQ